MFGAGEFAKKLVAEVGLWVCDSGKDGESIGEAGGEGEGREEEVEEERVRAVEMVAENLGVGLFQVA